MLVGVIAALYAVAESKFGQNVRHVRLNGAVPDG
jgi:hypothetical protein